MIFRDHPLKHLLAWLHSNEKEVELEFSRYIYRHYGETLSREIFQVPSSKVTGAWLTKQIDGLGDDQELAIHSRVKFVNGDVYHIPMIDFINTESPEVVTQRMWNVNRHLRVPINLYRSGNSLHGYFFVFIAQSDWYKFLGRALLCNLPDRYGTDVVDARWVGHSLRHGFSALRWSKHTDLYKKVPTFVRVGGPALSTSKTKSKS
jgi:hypothetical protein